MLARLGCYVIKDYVKLPTLNSNNGRVGERRFVQGDSTGVESSLRGIYFTECEVTSSI